MKRYEENIYQFLVGTDFNDRNNLGASISELSRKLLFDRDDLREKLQSAEGSDFLNALSERLSNRAHIYYLSKGYEGINANMFKLMVSRLVQTLGCQLLEGDIDQEMLNDLIRSDVHKIWKYVKKEPTLACFFEGY